jgi:hypothetical protein
MPEREMHGVEAGRHARVLQADRGDGMTIPICPGCPIAATCERVSITRVRCPHKPALSYHTREPIQRRSHSTLAGMERQERELRAGVCGNGD